MAAEAAAHRRSQARCGGGGGVREKEDDACGRKEVSRLSYLRLHTRAIVNSIVY